MNARQRRTDRRRRTLKKEIRFVHIPNWFACATDEQRRAWFRRYGAIVRWMPTYTGALTWAIAEGKVEP